jgi:hypothetical protein
MSSPAADPPEPALATPSRPVAWQQVGAHRVRTVDDCVEWQINGPMSLSELQAIERHHLDVMDQYGYWMALVDCEHAGGLEPVARRYVAEQARLHPNRIAMSALYGCSPTVVALSTLVCRAVKLFSGKLHPVEICSDEASARACLAAFRKTHPGVPRAKRPTTH